MDIERIWEKALKHTEVIRPRVEPLSSYGATLVPYIMLSESLGGSVDTVVRRGNVQVEKPSLILPSNHPQLEGFEMNPALKREADVFMDFLLVRGIRLPSMLYNNKTDSLGIHEGNLSKAVEFYRRQLEREENVHSGLVLGPEDCWQFSLLIFIAGQVLRSADNDIRRLLEKYRREGGNHES